jgi:small ligand-binding sensory domain FIST
VDRERTVTASDGNLVLMLDDEPALDVLLRERVISLEQPEEAMPRLRATLVGLSPPLPEHSASSAPAPRVRGQFGTEVLVRHLIGLDPGRRGIAIADVAPVGTRLAFCERNAEAARADLVRVCAEVREELEPEELGLSMATALSSTDVEAGPHAARRIAGAVYVSCSGRGGPHFGSPSAELQVVRRALGDVPLVGFFAGGEIAHHSLYGYTGVLTVFTMP